MEGDLLRRFERHMPYIGHVQIANAPLRLAPDKGENQLPRHLRSHRRLPPITAPSASNTSRPAAPRRISVDDGIRDCFEGASVFKGATFRFCCWIHSPILTLRNCPFLSKLGERGLPKTRSRAGHSPPVWHRRERPRPYVPTRSQAKRSDRERYGNVILCLAPGSGFNPRAPKTDKAT